MSKKLNVPSITGLNVEGMPYGVIVFLQAVQDALNTLDSNVVYHDDVTENNATPNLRAVRAQGQAFSVAGTSVASGEDYYALVQDVKALLQDFVSLRTELNNLKKEIKGT